MNPPTEPDDPQRARRGTNAAPAAALRAGPRAHALPLGARLARATALSLCVAAARLYRTAAALERPAPGEVERCYARGLVTRYGKLD